MTSRPFWLELLLVRCWSDPTLPNHQVVDATSLFSHSIGLSGTLQVVSGVTQIIFVLILLLAFLAVVVTALQHRRHSALTNQRLCRGCGQSHPPFAFFCRRCGRKLDE